MNNVGVNHGGTADLSTILGITNVQTLPNRPSTSVAQTRPNTKAIVAFNNKVQGHRRVTNRTDTQVAEKNINMHKFDDHSKFNTQY